MCGEGKASLELKHRGRHSLRIGTAGPRTSSMGSVSTHERWERLFLALEGGADAAAVRELMVELGQETNAERVAAARALRLAIKRETDVFQAVLDGMRNEVNGRKTWTLTSGLSEALKMNDAAATMAIAKRMRRETTCNISWLVLEVLLDSQIFQDEEVVDAVANLIPAAIYGCKARDAFVFALYCKEENRERAVDLFLKYGPPMEEKMAGKSRFHYVNIAAQSCDVKMVQKMHDLVPMLSDGSGRRGVVSDYAKAVEYASCRSLDSSPMYPILDYLVEQGASEVIRECYYWILLERPTVEDVEWFLARAPRLDVVCRDEQFLRRLIEGYDEVGTRYLMEQMAELVDRKVIAGMMRQIHPNRCGWRSKLATLHEAVPECMDGLRWKWLMSAIEEREYDDVAYMLGMCTREHLGMRDGDGDTAYEVALMDEDFLKEVLCRLKVVKKGALS